MPEPQSEAQRFKRLQALFVEAIELTPAQRQAWLDSLAPADAALREPLLRLLRRDAEELQQPTQRPQAEIASALSAAEAVEPPLPPRIGRFEIVGELGRGGMGRVLHGLCRQHGIEQHAAIKVLRGDSRDPLAQARLHEEARALASLEHPGIARLLEAGRSEDGTVYVAMERVRGESLLAHCAARSLDLRARIELFRGILAAVGHAHRALVVHRDLKPSNVMVDIEGRPRLLDFGLARFIEHEPESRTQTAARFLTPAYAAPEQVRGERITIACDLYALGAVLYELLSGVPPFELSGLTAGEAERLLLQVPPQPLEQAFRQRPGAAARCGRSDVEAWARALRGDLEAIVQKALRKQPQQRYLSVEAFDADLQRWLRLRPVGARRGRLGYRAGLFLRRHAAASAGVALLLLGLGTAAQQVWQQGRIAAHERDRARAALSILNDAFVAADPSQSSAGETSVRAVLAAAAERVAAIAEQQPQLHAELVVQISEIRSRLGIVVEDGLVQRLLTAESLATLPAELALRLQVAAAREDILAQRLDRAGARIQALAAQRAHAPAIGVVAALRWLTLQEPGRALDELHATLPRIDSAVNPSLLSEARLIRARALRMAGDAGAALAELNALLRTEQALSGVRAQLRLHRLEVLIELDRLDEAESERIALQAELPAQFGERSAVMASLHVSHAGLLLKQERRAEAAAAFRQAAEVYAQALGDQHLNAARARFNAAQLRVHLDPLDDEADADFEAAIDSASRVRDPSSALPMFFRVSYARALLKRGERGRAQATLLPARGWPPAGALPEANHQALLTLLAEVFGPADCAAPLVAPAYDAPAPARAAYLQCKERPASLAGPRDDTAALPLSADGGSRRPTLAVPRS
jgi:eukaryotic-like serine/threonine-protein kinase